MIVNNDSNNPTQYWIIVPISNEYCVIMNKLYPNLVVTMRDGAISLSNFDLVNDNVVYKDNQLFKIEELNLI